MSIKIIDEKFPSDFDDSEFFSCASRDETLSTENKTISNYTASSSSSFLNQLNQSIISNERDERDEYSSSFSSTITGKLSENDDDSFKNRKSTMKFLISNENNITNEFKLDKIQKKNFFKKSLSYQDLHSNYTKKKYKHVKSKVRQYIADLQAQNQNHNQKISKNLYDNCSLQNNLFSDSDSRTLFENQQCFENMGSNEASSENLTIVCYQKELESLKYAYNDLKRINDYLQNNYEEKSAQAAKAQRIAETVKIELCNLKERSKLEERKRFSRNSLPTSCLLYGGYDKKISTATQTADLDIIIEPITPQNNKISVDTYLNFTDTLDLLKCSGDNLRQTKSSSEENNLRRRSNSNSIQFNKRNSTDLLNNVENYGLTTPINSGNNNGSDSAIEIERSDEMLRNNSSSNNLAFNSPEIIVSSIKRSRKKRKPNLFKKKYWKSVILACIRCQVNDNNDISYTQIPLSDTMFEFKNIH